MLEEIEFSSSLSELADQLTELWELYHSTDGRKKKVLQEIQEKYNEGANLYNETFAKQRFSDKKPVVKLIK